MRATLCVRWDAVILRAVVGASPYQYKITIKKKEVGTKGPTSFYLKFDYKTRDHQNGISFPIALSHESFEGEYEGELFPKVPPQQKPFQTNYLTYPNAL